MLCENCGNLIAEGSKFCMSCGEKIEIKEAAQEVAASVESIASMESTAAAGSDPIPAAPSMPAQPTQSQAVPPPARQTVQPVQPVAQPIQQTIHSSAAQEVPPEKIQKPASIKPLPVWKYIGIFLLLCIPVLGLVMLFVWSFGESFNRNTKNFARASLILIIIMIVLMIVSYFTLGDSLKNILSNFSLPMTY